MNHGMFVIIVLGENPYGERNLILILETLRKFGKNVSEGNKSGEMIMAIKFKEIKRCLARNVRLSICFEDGHYHDYLMVSNISDSKYDRLYVYGIGMIDVEFSRDVYSKPQEPQGVMTATKDDTLKPAIEVVLYEKPREIERSTDGALVFRDLKPYLQHFGYFSVVDRRDWSHEAYELRDEIPEKYDDMYVYGIGMEDNPDIDERLKERQYDTHMKKRMVIVLSDKPREDALRKEEAPLYGKGPFFLLITAEEWNHDADEWLGIYVGKKEAREAYDGASVWYETEREQSRYSSQQKLVMVEYIPEENRFRTVGRQELD